jgi:hypothetical protein
MRSLFDGVRFARDRKSARLTQLTLNLRGDNFVYARDGGWFKVLTKNNDLPSFLIRP